MIWVKFPYLGKFMEITKLHSEKTKNYSNQMLMPENGEKDNEFINQFTNLTRTIENIWTFL